MGYGDYKYGHLKALAVFICLPFSWVLRIIGGGMIDEGNTLKERIKNSWRLEIGILQCNFGLTKEWSMEEFKEMLDNLKEKKK